MRQMAFFGGGRHAFALIVDIALSAGLWWGIIAGIMALVGCAPCPPQQIAPVPPVWQSPLIHEPTPLLPQG